MTAAIRADLRPPLRGLRESGDDWDEQGGEEDERFHGWVPVIGLIVLSWKLR